VPSPQADQWVTPTWFCDVGVILFPLGAYIAKSVRRMRHPRILKEAGIAKQL